MDEKILVVDDEPLILSTVKRALVKKGYEVRIAPDPAEFLEQLGQEASDLLLMDMNLGGLNSESLMGSVKKLAPEAKIIFMSGLIPEREDIYFLEKPFTLEQLRQLVRDVLDGNAKPGAHL